MKKNIVLLAVVVIWSCEIPVEPMEVVINKIEYINLNWIAAYDSEWTSEGCLQANGSTFRYITGQYPFCDPDTGTECGLLRIHSIQYNDGVAWAVLDYSAPDHPETIRAEEIRLERWVYEER